MTNKKTNTKLKQAKKKSVAREYTEAILIALALALFIRTFIVQAFKIPSGSMKDTLLIGDHLLVTKFKYGIHIPNEILFFGNQLFDDYTLFQKIPERKDIIVFKFPDNEKRDFIKRVIGLPGETLEIRRQKVYINGKVLDDSYTRHNEKPENFEYNIDYACPSSIPENTESFMRATNSLSMEYRTDRRNYPRDNLCPIKVPEGHVFVMGDNRENSEDSRFWGFVDVRKIRGKALLIYWSWDHDKNWVRFGRFGDLIN
ncbi:MAG: signal peptidase I [Nitrospinales bacterium]